MSAVYLLTAMCRGSPKSLADLKNGPLTVLGEAEENHPSDSVAGSACDRLTTCPSRRGSLRSLAENGPLMAPADWGRAKEADEVKESRPVTSIPLTTVALLATLGAAAHSPTLVMIPGYSVRVGGRPRTCDVPLPPAALSATTNQLMAMCPCSPRTLADSENGRLTVLPVGEAEESHPSDSVAALAGDLLTTMCRG